MSTNKIKNKTKCNCGNPEYGFDCTCEWERKHPGNKHFTCEFCGIYVAGKARCNMCEEFIDDDYEI